jgi:hypothetical protein
MIDLLLFLQGLLRAIGLTGWRPVTDQKELRFDLIFGRRGRLPTGTTVQT